MILQEETEIFESETAGELHDRLKDSGAKLLIRAVRLILEGKADRTAQIEEDSSYAPMLKKEIGKIDFSKSAQEISNLIRGTNPWPIAYCIKENETFRIHKARVTKNTGNLQNLKPGQVLGFEEDKGLLVLCGDGNAISFFEVQAQGGRKMGISEYLCGHPIKEGFLFQ